MKSISPSKQIYTFIINDAPKTTTFFIDILDSRYTYLNVHEHLEVTRGICGIIDDLKISLVDDVKDTDGKRLCFIHSKSVSIDDYVNTLKVRCEKYKAGETFTSICEEIYFVENMLHNSLSLHRRKVDVWWDFENNIMFMFGKKRANVVLKALIKTSNKIYNRVHEMELRDYYKKWSSNYKNVWVPDWNYDNFRNVFQIKNDDPTCVDVDTSDFKILFPDKSSNRINPLEISNSIIGYDVYRFYRIENNEIILYQEDPRTKKSRNFKNVDITEFCNLVKYQKILFLVPK